jgi:hypothetical protein
MLKLIKELVSWCITFLECSISTGLFCDLTSHWKLNFQLFFFFTETCNSIPFKLAEYHFISARNFSVIPCIVLPPNLMFPPLSVTLWFPTNHLFAPLTLPYILCYIQLTSTKINAQSKPSFDICKFPVQNSSGDQVHWMRFIAVLLFLCVKTEPLTLSFGLVKFSLYY